MDAVEALTQAIDLLAEVDSFSYGDGASVEALEEQSGRLACVMSKALASFDASGEWAHDGAQSTAAWLSTRCHLPLAEARRQLRRGRALPALPVVAQAFASGTLGVAQVDLLVKAAHDTERADPHAFGRDEAVLVHAAQGLKFGPFCAAVSYWTQLADPDGAEASEMDKMARRDVYLTQSVGGVWLGKMTLGSINGAICSNELVRLETELFDADWAQAKALLGRDPHLDELDRTQAQRRADALVEMAVRSAAMPEGSRRPEPLFSVLVDYPTLAGTAGRICQLEGGGVLTPGSLSPWLDTAWFERIVFAPGRRIECSVTSRLFTGATRRAIEVRDQTCTHPYCETPAQHCQIDHIVPYSQGGETTQENGRVLCGFHNRRRTSGPDPGG